MPETTTPKKKRPNSLQLLKRLWHRSLPIPPCLATAVVYGLVVIRARFINFVKKEALCTSVNHRGRSTTRPTRARGNAWSSKCTTTARTSRGMT